MKRHINHSSGELTAITPDVIQRVVCKQDWWRDLAPRVFDEHHCSSFELSFPEDFKLSNRNVL